MTYQSPIIILVIGVCSNTVGAFRTYQSVFHSRQNHIHLAPQQLGEFEPINSTNEDCTRRRVWLYDYVSALNSSTIPYNDVWEQQKSLVSHQLSRIGKGQTTPPLYNQFIPLDMESEKYEANALLGCDSIIMVEHDPVYTLGTGSDASFIHGYHADDDNQEKAKISEDTDEKAIPIVRIERGGEVTYHGPGQLVVYPILDLRAYNQDIHWYMRALEEVIILALHKAGIKGATREEHLTGVWVSNKKIAALGIKARRWVTMHGLAINVDLQSLQNFKGIVPCGIEGRDVTCINGEVANNSNAFTIREFSVYVREAMEEIFGITLVTAPLDQQ